MAPVQRQRHRRAAGALAVGEVHRGRYPPPVLHTTHTTTRACCSALVGLLQANARAPPAEQVPASDVYMMAPAVASKMLAAMAKHHGFNFEETLTGFKWAGNKVLCCTRRANRL